jgi:hypothetical protein
MTVGLLQQHSYLCAEVVFIKCDDSMIIYDEI